MKKWSPKLGDRVRMVTDHTQTGVLTFKQAQGHFSPEGTKWYVDMDRGSPKAQWVYESDIEPEVTLVYECPCGIEHLTPMNYYVTVRDSDNGNRVGLLAGPFPDHATALEWVEPASRAAIENNAWNHFHSYGTAGLPLVHRTPGLFNAKLGLDANGMPAQAETQPPGRSLQEGTKAVRETASQRQARNAETHEAIARAARRAGES